MKKHSIPIIFAITGHRDLRSEDISILTNRLTELFQKYQKNYPNTELILLSALAEGADILVASVARELGITLHIVLPYSESAYLSSFDDIQNIEEFVSLKEYASKLETLPCKESNSQSNCFQILGEYLADTSNILIALWDGVDSGKSSGTSAIVRYVRQGFEVNRFDALDGNALVVIKTPRDSNPDIQTDFSIEYEYLGRHLKGVKFDGMLEKIDSLNAKIQIERLQDNSISKRYISYFEKEAKTNQIRYRNHLKALLILRINLKRNYTHFLTVILNIAILTMFSSEISNFS